MEELGRAFFCGYAEQGLRGALPQIALLYLELAFINMLLGLIFEKGEDRATWRENLNPSLLSSAAVRAVKLWRDCRHVG